MSIKNKFFSSVLSTLIGTSVLLISVPSYASDAGAFIGGVFATKLLQNSTRRADAEQQQAYASQAPVQSASNSPQQRISELDKLAAGGYITPAQYKTKKQAIIDSM
ncbi:MAG: hypothetical protein KAI02_08480 [Gammaproteobacteria bacterium]|nr:hypothetical protein [Gammaproteobacteria bacterium]